MTRPVGAGEACVLAPVVSGSNDGAVDANGVGERRQNRHCEHSPEPEEGRHDEADPGEEH